jgi:hypothetical protein
VVQAHTTPKKQTTTKKKWNKTNEIKKSIKEELRNKLRKIG